MLLYVSRWCYIFINIVLYTYADVTLLMALSCNIIAPMMDPNVCCHIKPESNADVEVSLVP